MQLSVDNFVDISSGITVKPQNSGLSAQCLENTQKQKPI